MPSKQLSIILPSYNDTRIARAIRSIRRFDDVQTVKIIVVDGGSFEDIRQLIRKSLSSDDVFLCESDRGIFDALNKGLDASDTAFIGWLGSDDVFTGKLPASKVIEALSEADLLVTNLGYFRNGYITRITHALPSRIGLNKFGLHNGHFSTFGAATLLKSERFRLGLRASDVDYFIRIFNRRPRIVTSNVVAALQEEGGYSNSSVITILRTNLELVSVYARYTNWLWAPIAVMIKLGYKAGSHLYYRVVPSPVTPLEILEPF